MEYIVLIVVVLMKFHVQLQHQEKLLVVYQDII